MSIVKIQGNLSGTGTLTIAAPNTNSDYTVTLPTSSGTLVLDGASQSPTFGTVTATALSVNGNNISAVNSLGFRNRIINGDMRIDQRNAGASVTPTTSAYTLDRWQYQCSVASKMSIQQNAGSVTPPVGFSNYLGLTTASAYTAASGEVFEVAHKVEGFNFSDLNWGSANAASVTLSFWARSSLTGTHSGSFTNGAGNRSYPFTYTISAANTWEYKTITVAGDTTGTWVGATNGTGVVLYFDMGSGSTFRGTAGAWAGANYVGATGAVSVVGTSGATFYITGVQLEAGSVATPFERRDYGRELIMCQRYYAKQSVFIGNTYAANGGNVSASTYVGFKVTMRASPTITFVNTSALLTNLDSAAFTSADGFSYTVNITGTGTFNRASVASMEIEL